MEISFFYTRGGAGTIRGHQIAQYLGAKENPEVNYENDICIYVKTHKHPFHPKHSYIDVCDAPRAIEYLKSHPEIGVIALGVTQRDKLKELLNRDDIVLIPHHHCNFDRELRPDREVKVVGIMGNKNAFQYPIEDIRAKLKDIGLELKYEEDYWNTYGEDRQKIVDFYKSIDIQIVWRPKAWSPRYEPLRSPLKLSNAGSFGIPTVSYPELDYTTEWLHDSIFTRNIDNLIVLVKELKDNDIFYREYAEKGIKKAEEYHIDNIINMYKELKCG